MGEKTVDMTEREHPAEDDSVCAAGASWDAVSENL